MARPAGRLPRRGADRCLAHPKVRQEPGDGVLRRTHRPRAADGQSHRGRANDRNDLDDSLFTTFSPCADLLPQPPVQARPPGDDDIIDGYARHMRDALPNASFIGFTGTPMRPGRGPLVILVGDHRRHEDTVAPHDRARPSPAWNRRVPGHVLGRAPRFGKRGVVGHPRRSLGAAELRPVEGQLSDARGRTWRVWRKQQRRHEQPTNAANQLFRNKRLNNASFGPYRRESDQISLPQGFRSVLPPRYRRRARRESAHPGSDFWTTGVWLSVRLSRRPGR